MAYVSRPVVGRPGEGDLGAAGIRSVRRVPAIEDRRSVGSGSSSP
jgi:hypothetical protein